MYTMRPGVRAVCVWSTCLLAVAPFAIAHAMEDDVTHEVAYNVAHEVAREVAHARPGQAGLGDRLALTALLGPLQPTLRDLRAPQASGPTTRMHAGDAPALGPALPSLPPPQSRPNGSGDANARRSKPAPPGSWPGDLPRLTIKNGFFGLSDVVVVDERKARIHGDPLHGAPNGLYYNRARRR